VNSHLTPLTALRRSGTAVFARSRRAVVVSAGLALLAAAVACSEGEPSRYPGGVYPAATTVTPVPVPADDASDAAPPVPEDTGVTPVVPPRDTGAADVKSG
jgi:hypothetical protein